LYHFDGQCLMRRRTFVTITGAAASGILLKPSLTVFSRSPGLTENQEADLLTDLVDAAMSRGAEYADARMQSQRTQNIQLRKDVVSTLTDVEERGFILRAYRNGGWASAAHGGAQRLNPARMATEVLAGAAIAAARHRVPFAGEGRASHNSAEYSTPVERNPFDVSLNEKLEFLREITTFPLTIQQIPYTVANLFQSRTENHFFSSLNARLRQTFTSMYQNYAVTAISEQRRRMDSRSSPREAKAGGWELLKEYSKSELETLMQEALKKLLADDIQDGALEIVVDPTVMWDLITDTLLPHLDARRVLQRDGLRPGGRWVSEHMVGSATIASELLSLHWDNTLPGGLATCGWDDSGRPGDSGTLIENGKLLRIAGSDEIDSLPPHVAFTRGATWRQPAQCGMPNVVMRAGPGKNLQQLIAGVEDGLLIRGRGSIVTNPQRTIVRLRPQIGWRIRKGETAEVVRDFEIEIATDQLWNNLTEVGGPATMITAGELFPDRSYPLWTQPFSVAAPAAVFRSIPVYSSKEAAS
jgi:TldD protein